jgi:hypothetical protein
MDHALDQQTETNEPDYIYPLRQRGSVTQQQIDTLDVSWFRQYTYTPYNDSEEFYGCWIPENLQRYRGLNGGEKLIYVRLVRYAGKNATMTKPLSADEIGDTCGIGGRQAEKYLKSLERKGFIRSYDAPDMRKKKRYVLRNHEVFWGACGQSRAHNYLDGYDLANGGEGLNASGGFTQEGKGRRANRRRVEDDNDRKFALLNLKAVMRNPELVRTYHKKYNHAAGYPFRTDDLPNKKSKAS